MATWILIVTLASGQTIGSPFETEKECQVMLKQVKQQIREGGTIVAAECAQGEITQEEGVKKSDESFI